MNQTPQITQTKLSLAIIVSALGYFVDVYDIILFTAVRVPSLQSLGLNEEQITSTGIQLINIQLLGMLLGGIIWGMLGDKQGRLSILFGSIILYSSATFANAFVTSIEAYAVLRFLAGVGLAGEFGAGITLVSELMTQKTRGYGTTIVTTAGVLGGMSGGLVGNFFTWQTAYIIGGIAGFLLLLMRIGLVESRMYIGLKQQTIFKGNFFKLIASKILLKRYLKCLSVGTPFWIFVGLFMTLSPEIGKALNVSEPVKASWAILFFNVGLGIGDLSSGFLSQWMGSRKKVASSYIMLAFVFSMAFLSLHNPSVELFYFFCVLLGMSAGYWAIFMIMTAEQFGTNIRATVVVSIPNFVRGMVLIFSALLTQLKPHWGILASLEMITGLSIMMAWTSLMLLEESYAKNMDFVESN